MKHSDLHRAWMNNNTGQLFVACPWWETVEPEDKNYDISVSSELGLNCIKFGTFYQVGWLVQNEHGIWIGVNYDVTGDSNDFTDLGSMY